MEEVGFKPPTSCSGVRRSTTEPLRSPLGDDNPEKVSLILHKNLSCRYSLVALQQGASNEYIQPMFLWRIDKVYPSVINKYPIFLGNLSKSLYGSATFSGIAF